MNAVLAQPAHAGTLEWTELAVKARQRRRAKQIFLYVVMAIGALPILIPYLWLFTVAFSGRTGASTFVLWRTLAVLLPALFLWSVLRLSLEVGQDASQSRNRARSRDNRPARDSDRPLHPFRQLAVPLAP